MTSGSSILCSLIHKFPRNTQHEKVTEAQRNAVASAFYRSDDRHKGYLTREDLKVAIVSLFGYKPSKYEVNQLIGLDKDENKGLNLQEFTEAMSLKMASLDEDDVIRQTFLTFDTQCQGFLVVEDFRKVLTQVAPHMSAHTAESAFREIDRDGRVSYKDFEFMMKYNIGDGF